MLNSISNALLNKIRTFICPKIESPVYDIIRLFKKHHTIYLKEIGYQYQIVLMEPNSKNIIPYSPELTLPKLEEFCRVNFEKYKSIYHSIDNNNQGQHQHSIIPFWEIESFEFEWTRNPLLENADIGLLNTIYLVKEFAIKAKLRVEVGRNEHGGIAILLNPLDQGAQ